MTNLDFTKEEEFSHWTNVFTSDFMGQSWGETERGDEMGDRKERQEVEITEEKES